MLPIILVILTNGANSLHHLLKVCSWQAVMASLITVMQWYQVGSLSLLTPKGYKPSGIKQCPATVVDSQAQCVTCSLCSGDKANVYVEAHGSGAKYVTNLA